MSCICKHSTHVAERGVDDLSAYQPKLAKAPGLDRFETCQHTNLLATWLGCTSFVPLIKTDFSEHLQIAPPTNAGDQCLVFGVPTPMGVAMQGSFLCTSELISKCHFL